MPLYQYRCGEGHEVERLRKYEDRDAPEICEECGSAMRRIFSAHHQAPDGIYSYAPNIGSAEAFERKQAEMEARNR